MIVLLVFFLFFKLIIEKLLNVDAGRGGGVAFALNGVMTADCGFKEYLKNTRVEVVLQKDKSFFDVLKPKQ